MSDNYDVGLNALHWSWMHELNDLMRDHGSYSAEVEEYIEDRAWDHDFVEDARFSQIIREALLARQLWDAVVAPETRSEGLILGNWLESFMNYWRGSEGH
jgi:hypothetical protein